MLPSFDKIFVIALIAVMLLGPTRLPIYAQKLGQLVRTVRGMADTARARMKEEMGEEYNDVDWQKLDPRQYDPRRIIRDALLDEPTTVISTPASAAAASAVAASLPTRSSRATVVPLSAGEAPPYDNEAT